MVSILNTSKRAEKKLKKHVIDIALLTQQDLHELAILQRELIDEEADIIRMRELLPMILQDRNYYLLRARKNGVLVGSLAAIVCHDLFGKCMPFMIIENMIVTGDERGQGIGTLLMQEAEIIAQERKCRYIALISSANRREAHRFYHRLGYRTDPYKGFKKIVGDLVSHLDY
jgi:phosphoglycolate phosphatase